MKSMFLKTMLVSVLTAAVVFAVDPVEVWERDYDSGVRDWAAGIGIDQDDNVYVLGNSLTGTDSIDSGIFLLMKYTSFGDSVWLKTRNPGIDVFSSDMCIDLSGNIYTIGTSDTDYYTIKWDQGGNIIWERPFYAEKSTAASVACDASGNIYVVGGSFVVVKYDSSGNVLWNESNSSLPYARANCVTVSQDGSVYIGGFSNDGGGDVGRILKYDSSGNPIWNKVCDSVRYVFGLAVDPDDYVYFTGWFGSEDDAVVCKLDPEGNILWKKTYDAGNIEIGQDVVVDEHFVYMVGIKLKVPNSDLLIQRNQKDGTLDWTVTKNWYTDDHFGNMASDNKGSLYAFGEAGGNLKLVKYNQPDYPVSGIEDMTDLKCPWSRDRYQ